MAIYQLLVRIKDKVNPTDARLDAMCTKRGDVIAIMGEDHQWGAKELSNPEWMIIKAELTPEQVISLTASELPTSISKNEILRKRAIKLDLDSLGNETKFDGKCKTLDVDKKIIRNAIKLKDKLSIDKDNEIGPQNDDVIGPN